MTKDLFQMKTSNLRLDVTRYMQEFTEKAEKELWVQLKKIGKSEITNTRQRLERSITDNKNMVSRVAETIDADWDVGAKGGQIRFGSRNESGSSFGGITGQSRIDKSGNKVGANLSALTAFGKKRAKPLDTTVRVKPSSKITSSRTGVGLSTGRLIALPKGYVSREWSAVGGKSGKGWLETAEENILEKMKKIPEQLKETFRDVGI